MKVKVLTKIELETPEKFSIKNLSHLGTDMQLIEFIEQLLLNAYNMGREDGIQESATKVAEEVIDSCDAPTIVNSPKRMWDYPDVFGG